MIEPNGLRLCEEADFKKTKVQLTIKSTIEMKRLIKSPKRLFCKTDVRRSAFHIVDASPTSQVTNRVPIWVYEVNENDVFPVKFEYKARGYKGLRFSERKERIEFE